MEITNRSSLLVQSIADTRAQLDDLQRQLGTGQKSTTYAGLGTNRGLTVSLRNQLNLISGYADAATNVGVRIDLAQNALTGISSLATGVRGAAQTAAFTVDSSGQTATQRSAVGQLDQILVASQHPVRRPLSVLRARHQPAGGRHGRSYSQRRRDTCGLQPGRWRSATRQTSAPMGSAGWWLRR